MCDYHSISVNRRGTIAHTESNSHSEAVEKVGWKENTTERIYHWDFEYDPDEGDYYGALHCMRKHFLYDHLNRCPTQRILDSVDAHYQRLVQLHKGDVSMLEYFSKLQYSDVRDKLSANPSTSPEMLSALSKIDKRTRFDVALNPSTPPDILRSFSENPNMRFFTSRNHSTPPDLLASMGTSDNTTAIRFNIASNPSTPTKTLLKLKEDKVPMVRQAARCNLASNQDQGTERGVA